MVFNGRANQYASHPIEVQPNELLRLYVVNAGPKRISSFHVVGGIFERVFQDGSKMSPLAGVQTVNIPVGGGSIFELRLRQPGHYPFVTREFAAPARMGTSGFSGALPVAEGLSAAGNVTVTRSPPPDPRLATTVPPCSVTIEAVAVRPSPGPPSRALAVSLR